MDGNGIWAALAAVQAQLKSQAHTRRVEVGKYGYTYTELSALADYLLPLLGGAGICTTYTSGLTASGDALAIECRLTASDGSHVEAATIIQPASWSAQDVGKILTYGRRYTLQMATGIATEADDDCAPQDAKSEPRRAAAASAPARPVDPTPRIVPPPTVPVESGERAPQDGITEPQKKRIFALVRALAPEGTDDDKIRSVCTKQAQGMYQTTVSELTKKQASAVMDWISEANWEKLTDDLPFDRR